jgi:hypothetical protein
MIKTRYGNIYVQREDPGAGTKNLPIRSINFFTDSSNKITGTFDYSKTNPLVFAIYTNFIKNSRGLLRLADKMETLINGSHSECRCSYLSNAPASSQDLIKANSSGERTAYECLPLSNLTIIILLAESPGVNTTPDAPPFIASA